MNADYEWLFYNESDNVSSFVSNGESIADSEGLFELDMDNYNLISYGEELSETDYQKMYVILIVTVYVISLLSLHLFYQQV